MTQPYHDNDDEPTAEPIDPSFFDFDMGEALSKEQLKGASLGLFGAVMPADGRCIYRVFFALIVLVVSGFVLSSYPRLYLLQSRSSPRYRPVPFHLLLPSPLFTIVSRAWHDITPHHIVIHLLFFNLIRI